MDMEYENQADNLIDTERGVNLDAIEFIDGYSNESLLTESTTNLVSTNTESTINTESNTNIKSTIHYDSFSTISDLVELSGDTAYNEIKFSAQLPLFFESQQKRFVPNKVKFAIERYCSAKDLNEIHKDKEVAVELCLVLLSNLSNAFYNTHSAGWKRLNAGILRDQVSNTKQGTYKKIVNLLLKGTKKRGPIIERSRNYTVGQESYRYRLGENYREKGVSLFEFKTTYCKNLLSKNYFERLNVALDNPIARNLIRAYSIIELPSIKEIKKEAKKLIKEGYRTKKGKILTKRNKHANSYWSDADNRSFVEDNIELFLRLTENGYLIPIVSEENAGGRVTDSFNLMPSWIRNLCKINGQKIVEADYSCLHPNLAVKIYNGVEKYITHEKVAEKLNMEPIDVKIDHLSFFNHEWSNMYKSPLFNYYNQSNYLMLEKIHKDKVEDHKITSRKMFSLEVDIMTAVIKRLNSEGIYVGYVYDALFTSPKHKERVTEVMNEEILKFGVYTKAK